MLTLSSYIKALKKYANNISISDDEFFRALFGYIIDTLDIRNKNNKNELYDFTKSRISGILNQKEDVPSAIRTAVSHYSAEKKVIDVFPFFNGIIAIFMDWNSKMHMTLHSVEILAFPVQ